MITSAPSTPSARSESPAARRRMSPLIIGATLLVSIALAAALNQHGGVGLLAAATGGVATFILLWAIHRLVASPRPPIAQAITDPATSFAATAFQRELDRLASADDNDETLIVRPPQGQSQASVATVRPSGSGMPDDATVPAHHQSPPLAIPALPPRRSGEPAPPPLDQRIAPTLPAQRQGVERQPVGRRQVATRLPSPPPVPNSRGAAPMQTAQAAALTQKSTAAPSLADTLPWLDLSGRQDLVRDYIGTEPPKSASAPPPVATARPLSFPDLPEVSADDPAADAPPQSDSYVGARIRKLADDLKSSNPPERPDFEPVLPRGPERTSTERATTEDALSASIDALRSAAHQLHDERAERSYPTLPLPSIEGRWSEADFDALRRPEPELPRPAEPAAHAAISEPPASTSPQKPASFARPAPISLAEEIKDALLGNRIEVVLTPVIGLLDRRMRHFDVDVRLRTLNGERIDASRATTEESSSVGLIDAARLTRTADVANVLTERIKTGGLVCRIASASLRSAPFMATASDLAATRPEFVQRLVLALSQTDVRGLDDSGRQALEELRARGFRFCLDDITDAEVDFARLQTSGFAFAKIAAPALLEGLSAGRARISPADVCRHLASLDMSLIATGINTEELRAGVFEIGIAFGQGLLLGSAKTMRADVVAKAARSAAA